MGVAATRDTLNYSSLFQVIRGMMPFDLNPQMSIETCS